MATISLHPPAVHAMAKHVSDCLGAHRARFSTRFNYPPLFVGVQGPQGSGKTFLTSRLRSLLAEPPHSLLVAVLSIDDLYLPHAGLTALAEMHPQNRLLHGRGQPGTHDVELGREILKALKAINDAEGGGPGEVALPVFDKSMFDGEGDRASQAQVVRGPVDVVVLEGWCVGFYPVRREVVEERWQRTVPGLDDYDMQAFVSLEDVLEVNERLTSYVEWWSAFDAFIQIRGPPTSPFAIIYQWRLQQERDMKAKNGGRGMTDVQVKTFVDRYIPGYVFFGDGVRRGTVDEKGEVLTVMSAYGALSRPARPSNLPATAWPHPRDPHATVTLFHIDPSTLEFDSSSDEAGGSGGGKRHPGLFDHLHAVFADEVDRGLTYPQEDMRDPAAFRAYFFAADVVIAITAPTAATLDGPGDGPRISSDPHRDRDRDPLAGSDATGGEDGTVPPVVEVEVNLEAARADRSWDACVVGFYYPLQVTPIGDHEEEEEDGWEPSGMVRGAHVPNIMGAARGRCGSEEAKEEKEAKDGSNLGRALFDISTQ
ncbi:P-loop containing nucleoside triphosphate hydrolase protein [Lanmaoa asiatica]|nr:P-loop containing nucleoside triphosphate hydrolase protein [Lanmaoa asiatica]